MGKATQTTVSLTAGSVVGYWEPEPSEASAHQLAHLLTSHQRLISCRLGQEPRPGARWEVGLSGVPPEPQPPPGAGWQVALSVGGLGQADAWVHLCDRSLVLGRDGFGRQPLYWLQLGSVVWFASRFQSLLPLLAAPQVDLAALYGYSCFSYVPTPLTPIAGIQALAAGTEQTWDWHRPTTPWFRTVEPWQDATQQLQDETVAVAGLQLQLRQAVERQCAGLGPEPVGVFLSGGLDSSIVAALLRQAGVNVRAYTLDFGAATVSEVPYAEQVAAALDIPLTVVDASPRQIRRALVPAAQALDLPYGDGVTVPLFLLAQRASQDVAVVFNGEGGDQLFAGWTNKPLIAAGVYQATHPTDPSFEAQYLRTFHRLWGYEAQVFQPEIAAALRSLSQQQGYPHAWIQEALKPAAGTDLLHRLRRATLMLKGAQNIHPRATSLSQAHGLQVRSPFCDRAMAQWAFSVSSTLHLQGACEKYILKRAVADWLPTDIIWRSKRGMGVPLTAWCLGELWHDLGHWLNPARLRQEGLWHPQIAQQLVRGQVGALRGRRLGECLWLLLMWQVWRDAVLGASSPASSWNHPFWLPNWAGAAYLKLSQEFES